jgi:LAS superfamily LD-carboxypeptidase LdcB
MSKDIGNIKIKQAAQALKRAQRDQAAAEKKSQKAAAVAQHSPLKIAGGYRNVDQHKTAFQADLRASRDFIVPKATRSPKAATSTTFSTHSSRSSA